MDRRLALAAAFALLARSAFPADPQVARLVVQLRHPNPGLRGMAAMELGELGPAAKEAVGALAAALADEELNVRFWAAQALGGLGAEAKEAVPALVDALRTSLPGRGLKGPHRYYADARVVCAQALGRIGTAARSAIPALRDALRDEDASVRAVAAEALERIEGESPAR